MITKYIFKSNIILSMLLTSIHANGALVSYNLDFDNIQPPRVQSQSFSATPLNRTNYAGFEWGNGWFATSELNQDTYLSTSSGSLFIRRVKDDEGFQFQGLEYWSRGGDGDGRKFFYVLYGSSGNVLYNSEVAGDDLRLRSEHNLLISTFSDLVYGVNIGFINGGDNDGWKYLGVDDVKFAVDEFASVNIRFPDVAISNVPVPAAFTMLLAGIGVLGFFNRKLI